MEYHEFDIDGKETESGHLYLGEKIDLPTHGALSIKLPDGKD